MFLPRRRQFITAILSAAVLSACGGGGSSAPAPTIKSVTAGDTQIVIDWVQEPGVEYWLWFKAADTVSAGEKTASYRLAITAPYILTGLTNDTKYAITINGRTNGGPGGPGSVVQTATPRAAGSVWLAGGALGSSNAIRSVAYGLSSSSATTYSYVAVGDDGVIYSSPAYVSATALSWTQVRAASGTALNAALYALAKYVAVGDGGSVLTSTDTTTWAAATSGTTAKLNALATNSSIVVAVGANGTILHSSDGTTWTAATLVPTTNDLYGVTYSALGLWVAVGANGTLLTSSDGATWTAGNSGTTATLKAAASMSTVTTSGSTTYSIVAVGAGGVILSSTTGTAWSVQTQGSADLNAAASSSRFVALGDNGAVYSSTDGTTWTAASSPNSNTMYGVIHADNIFTAVGAAGTSIYSY
ncbi:MAG: hypothetical protein JSR69_07750 [Proteobacteria bacterium]|nr:hypothetical protein [Pseudomonadota bacterium]